MSLLAQFQQQIPADQHKFLIAFSGGLDSSVLLSLFKKFSENRPLFSPPIELRAIHIHHGLSPNANFWVSHCQQICQQLNIPLIIESVRIQGKQNLEAQAREARYTAIRQHLQTDEWLVTAHHLQDQSETFLLALKRGSGLQGLSAMQPQSQLYGMPIFRPLLNFTRADLQTYAEQQNLTWIEDESNQDNHYDRNFLRNQILPSLRHRWANWDSAVQRSAQHCFEQQQLINELLTDDFAQNFRKNDRSFGLDTFADYSPLKQKALLRLWFSQLDVAMPSSVQLAQLIQDVIFATADAQPEFQLGDWTLRRHQNRLYLTPPLVDLSQIQLRIQPNQVLTLPDHLGELSLTPQGQNWLFQWNEQKAILPDTALPVSIRFGYSGKVKIHPNRPHQDIKKIWQSFDVPVWQRRRIPLIFYGDELQAAVGFFTVWHNSNNA